MEPTWCSDCGTVKLWRADCLDVMPTWPDGCVDAVVTDPPYFNVLQESWDKQWRTLFDFLGWVDITAGELSNKTAINGSLYWCCGPRVVSQIEATISKHYHVLCSITWDKGDGRKGTAGSGVNVSSLRNYWPSSERVIFAEQYFSDQSAMDDSGYSASCEQAKRTIFGDYLRDEFVRAGVTNREISKLFPSKTGNLTGCVSNWLNGANVPTLKQYLTIRQHLNSSASGKFLRREYENLRREYENLRREYENLRREFSPKESDQWGDVWKFQFVRGERQHPAQKPISMVDQMVRHSTSLHSLVADPFMGSGTTGVAAVRLGRQFWGVEIDEKYFEIAKKRIQDELRKQSFLEPERKIEQKSLF